MIEYVRIVDRSPQKQDKFIASARVGRIYRVIEFGRDYYLLSVKGKPIVMDSWYCEPSNRDDYLTQDKKVEPEEDFSEAYSD
jgi:hypothetical protein